MICFSILCVWGNASVTTNNSGIKSRWPVISWHGSALLHLVNLPHHSSSNDHFSLLLSHQSVDAQPAESEDGIFIELEHQMWVIYSLLAQFISKLSSTSSQLKLICLLFYLSLHHCYYSVFIFKLLIPPKSQCPVIHYMLNESISVLYENVVSGLEQPTSLLRF